MVRQGDYREVLSDIRADLIFTSPPYNIGSKAPRSDGRRRRGLYDAKSFGAIRDYPDNFPEDEYQDQQAAFLVWAAEHLTANGTLVYNHKPRRRAGTMIHPASWFLRPEVTERLVLMEEVIWDRGSTHNHGRQLLWPHTERLYVFRPADGRYCLDNTNRLEFRSDVWRIKLESRAHSHNAPMPIGVAEAAIDAFSAVGDLVCDPYAGSGTTGIAALKLDRRFVGAEVLSKYAELARKRLATA